MVIGRGCRREHSMDSSEEVKWPSVTTGVVELPVAHAHTQGNAEGVKWPLVTSKHPRPIFNMVTGTSPGCLPILFSYNVYIGCVVLLRVHLKISTYKHAFFYIFTGQTTRASSSHHVKYRTRVFSSSNHAKYKMRVFSSSHHAKYRMWGAKGK
jgi:hypothetical protein